MNCVHRAFPRAMASIQSLGQWGLALAVSTVALPTHAQTLTAASTFVQCFADGNNSFHSTECTQGGFPGVPPSAFSSATLSPFPSVSVEVTSPPASVLGAGADANATYWFQVTGGNAGDVVPLLFEFNFGATSTPDSTALARIIIRTSEVPFTVEELNCNPQSCDVATLSDTLSVPARSGAMLDSVTLYVMVQAPATRISHESARAFADPYIFVDPAFPNAQLYSIVVSPGVGNVRVPEPAIPWILSIALSSFGFVRCRKLFSFD